MLGHDFQDMPTKTVAGEPENVLRCKWCMKTPTKAREDGCPIHELAEKGVIVLSEFNPGGVPYFKDRTCVTCGQPIMGHFLRYGSEYYWCNGADQFSEGISNCTHEVEGVAVPPEPEVKEWRLQ